MTDLAARAEVLRALHHAPEPLILANAWDVASAVMVERAGAAAVATTSSGVAGSLGYPDGESIPPEQMFAAIDRMAAAVAVPLTADVEGGYGLDGEALVGRLLAAGAVGMNIEDTDRTGGGRLLPVEHQARRIAEVRAAAEEAGVPVVINARIDVFLRGGGSPHDHLDEAIDRGRAYSAAGADCVYPIWLTDAGLIGRFVAEVPGPVNALLRPGAPSVAELTALGVRRLSVGGGLALHALAAAEAITRRLLAGDAEPFARIGET